MSEKISFVIPCYRSESTLEGVVNEVIGEIGKSLPQFDYEFVLVNDCSPDNTIDVIRRLCSDNPKIKGVDFARNFGQHSALLAGFRRVTGDYVVCLDDDGQMPIESIKDLIAELKDDADCVMGSYPETKQTVFRRIGSRINAKMNEILLNKPKGIEMNSFWGARRFVIDEIARYDGPYPYVGGLILRTTSHLKNISVQHRSRTEGQSGYTFIKLIKLWLNGFTAFSEKPLRIASFCGFLFAILGFIMMIVTFVHKLVNPDVTMGYSSIVCIILFLSGIIMLMLGLIGEYIGRSYISINRAPQYVVRDEYGAEVTKKSDDSPQEEASTDNTDK